MNGYVVLNFKSFKETFGKAGVELARRVDRTRSNGYEIIICPTLVNLAEIHQKTRVTIFSQHVDGVTQGPFTGHVSVDELKSIGVKGSLLNHSEYKLDFNELREAVELSKKKKFKNIVCASSLSELKKVAALEPSFVAYEPTDLIGGEVSVTSANPDIIVKAVEIVKTISPKTKFLVGAGIHSSEDLGQALLLGAHGVLIGHSIVDAKDPKQFLEKMLL